MQLTGARDVGNTDLGDSMDAKGILDIIPYAAANIIRRHLPKRTKDDPQNGRNRGASGSNDDVAGPRGDPPAWQPMQNVGHGLRLDE